MHNLGISVAAIFKLLTIQNNYPIMKKSPKYQPVTLVITSLNELYTALLTAKRKCEDVALKITNEQLKKTIIALEHLNTQYANELGAQIQSLGGNALEPEMVFLESAGVSNRLHLNLGLETKNICAKVEYPIIKLYRKILRQPILNASLKKMIQYQMNGIMC